ncbi:MAG TPA: hypothetical protein VFO39_22045 [Candidatus Sulfotelmatobacter sp.]|nr:hypothetical protein [Candidatus Sulfotelmatobacter sp.]
MKRSAATVLMLAIFCVSLPASAQNLVSPKLLPPPPSLRTGIQLRASLGQGSSTQTDQSVHRTHWTTGGKVMTFVGAGLVVLGAALAAQGASNSQRLFANDEKWAGVGILAGGSVLTIIGLTRRSSN